MLLLAVALSLGLAAASCGGEEEEAAAPPPPAEPAPPPPPAPAEPAPAPPEPAPAPPEPAPAECPVEGGVIKAFQAFDLAGTIGDGIGPAGKRMADLWIKKINDEGGILGCQFEVTIEDEAFPDVEACLREFRNAINSKEYHFLLGPGNSACLFALPALSDAAGISLVASFAGDHQPFMEKFGETKNKFIYHSAVATILEGRASAKFAADQGWKRIALMVPNFAYGQDVGKAFKEYFLQLVPDGEIVDEQFPEIAEEDFVPFITPMVAKKPDAIVAALFGNFIIPFWKQWKATGNDEKIPIISGLAFASTFEVEGLTEADIPANAYGYDRGYPEIVAQTPIGKEAADLYAAAYGDSEHPIPSSFTAVEVSALQMAKALIEKTGGVDPAAWLAAVEAGDFTYEGPYNAGPTAVDPINHMADNCASVGPIVWDESLFFPASYDVSQTQVYCMRDVVDQDARKLTDNPNVSDEAYNNYFLLAGAPG